MEKNNFIMKKRKHEHLFKEYIKFKDTCQMCLERYIKQTEYDRAYRVKNIEKIHQIEAKSRAKHYIKKLEYQHNRRLNNHEHVRNIERKCRLKNKHKHREYNLKYTLKRLHSNIQARLAHNLRSRIRGVLKVTNSKKHSGLIDLLGCTAQELKFHLESKFQEGMTWDNYGRTGWHIDHIKPCISFDLNDPAQQKQCFHFTNLQPLWAFDNYSKHGKIL
jgi:hypothetical protein